MHTCTYRAEGSYLRSNTLRLPSAPTVPNTSAEPRRNDTSNTWYIDK